MVRTSDETTLSKAVSDSDSLRTTIPMHIVRKLGLEKGDAVKWDIDKVGGRWIATVRKSR